MKEIKNITIYSEELVKDFLNVYYKERTKKFRIILNILIIMVIIYFFTNKNRNTIDMFTFIFALFGIIEVNTSMIPRFNFYRLKKRKNSILNAKIIYIFKKRNFSIKTNKEEFVDYELLYKVIENNKYYFLFINKYRTFIVDKSKMNKEDITELTNRLKEKVTTYIDNNV